MALKTDEVYAILKKQIQSGGVTPEQIQEAVNNYLTENPVQVIDRIQDEKIIEIVKNQKI